MANNKTAQPQNYKVMAKTYQWILFSWFTVSCIAGFALFVLSGIYGLSAALEPQEPIAESIGSIITVAATFTSYGLCLYGTYHYYQRISS